MNRPPSCGQHFRMGKSKRLTSLPFWITSLQDRKSTRLNSSHGYISYAFFCLKKKSIAYRNLRYTLTFILTRLYHCTNCTDLRHSSSSWRRISTHSSKSSHGGSRMDRETSSI